MGLQFQVSEPGLVANYAPAQLFGYLGCSVQGSLPGWNQNFRILFANNQVTRQSFLSLFTGHRERSEIMAGKEIKNWRAEVCDKKWNKPLKKKETYHINHEFNHRQLAGPIDSHY